MNVGTDSCCCHHQKNQHAVHDRACIKSTSFSAGLRGYEVKDGLEFLLGGAITLFTLDL